AGSRFSCSPRFLSCYSGASMWSSGRGRKNSRVPRRFRECGPEYAAVDTELPERLSLHHGTLALWHSRSPQIEPGAATSGVRLLFRPELWRSPLVLFGNPPKTALQSGTGHSLSQAMQPFSFACGSHGDASGFLVA